MKYTHWYFTDDWGELKQILLGFANMLYHDQMTEGAPLNLLWVGIASYIQEDELLMYTKCG